MDSDRQCDDDAVTINITTVNSDVSEELELEASCKVVKLFPLCYKEEQL